MALLLLLLLLLLMLLLLNWGFLLAPSVKSLELSLRSLLALLLALLFLLLPAGAGSLDALPHFCLIVNSARGVKRRLGCWRSFR